MATSFATQGQAERRIAELGKAGQLKPVHLPGRKWLLTTNREGTVSRTLLFHVVMVEYKKAGQELTPREANQIANDLWAQTARRI